MNWKDHIENLKSESVVSAAKAVRYLEKDTEADLEKALNNPFGGVKNWRERGVEPIMLNFASMIVERSALVYQKEPKRHVYLGETESEQLTAKYNDLLGYMGAVKLNQADKVARLLKTALVIVHYSLTAKRLIFDVLHRGICDVDYDLENQQIRSLLYQTQGVGMRNGRLLRYWDEEKVVELELVENGGVFPVSTEANPYGMIPVAVRYDVEPPLMGFWPRKQWQELVRVNETIERFHTDTGHASHFQAYPPLFTNVKIPHGKVVGPDAIIELEGAIDDIYLEYKTANINLEPFRIWLEGLCEAVADNWGVNLKIGGGGAADSGFKLIVEETWNLELRKQRQKTAKVTERSLFDVIKVVSNKHNLGIPENAELYVDFAEPQLAVDTIGEREQDRQDIAAGIMSRRSKWLKDDPDLTDEDMAAREQEIDGMRLPDFTNVNDG